MDRLYLNVFLVKPGLKAQAAVNAKGLSKSMDLPVTDGQTAKLHYGLSKGTPDWFTALAAQAVGGVSKKPETSSLSGVVIIPLGKSHFIVTFGHAWQRVDRAMVEPNFGVRCVLNLAERNKLKSIKRDRIADDFIQAIEQIPDADDIYRFDIDTDKDLLTGVKARVKESEDFGLQVSGSDSFKGSIDLSKETIGGYLTRCGALHKKTSYQKNFRWVDNVVPVRDDSLIGQLELQLAALVAANSADISLCIPDLLSWDDYDLFSYKTKRGGHSPVAYELSTSAWRAFAISEGKIIDADALRNSSVYAYQQASKDLKKKWSVLQCLHGSVSYKKRTYLAHGGRWFQIEQSFVAEIDAKVAALTISKLVLPPLQSLTETEGVYNARVAGASNGKIVLLDKKNIQHGGGRSRIEVCDLLTDSGELVCVKPWGGGSASLSHLFQQAQVACRLISEDGGFNAKVLAKLPASHRSVWAKASANTGGASVVLAVLRSPHPTKLPFFARLSLSMCVTALARMRFQPSYLMVT
ncbi:TIGR04141 family sporadically distributed protein [Pseudoxanthomonas sp. 10H]|uniref:TIGR04141 family sporadically distributed protein n=1 Tax=Pseudoxanthomonas sp. 10H TaxID=3242729 RepID=UPI0035572DEF